MVEAVAQFARAVLRPNVRDFEKARELPEAVRRTAHELGLGLVALPEALGGAGLELTTAVLLEEEIAWGDPAAAFALAGPGAFGLALVELGTEEQARAALAPFARDDGHARFGAVAWGEPKAHPERPGFSTIATKDGSGWRLDGAKAYVLNADRAEQERVEAQRLQSNIGEFLDVTMVIADGDLTKRGKVTEDVLGNVVDSINLMTDELASVLAVG